MSSLSRSSSRYQPHQIAQRLSWDALDPASLQALVQLARQEDLEGDGLRTRPTHSGDLSTGLLPDADGCCQAALVGRVALTVSGLPLVPLVLQAYGSNATFCAEVAEGQTVPPGTLLGTLTGPAAEMLPAERVLLNFLQRLSGIATQTRRFVLAMKGAPARLLDTRKTTPAHRLLEKYAVACGGGWNHRLGLYDRIMLKDNHLAIVGSQGLDALVETVRRGRERYPDVPLQVEVDSLEPVPALLEAGVDILLLDNFSLEDIEQALLLIQGRCLTEASGGITLETVHAYAESGVDFISTGALVHQATWVDIGLDWR